MTPSNTPRPLALSPSRASDYKRCPLQYRFRAIDRLPEPSTEAQVKGTLVHAVLEEMFSWPREERTYPAAVKRLKPTWEQVRIDDPTCAVPVEDDYQMLVDARTLLRGYFTMENPLGFDAHAQEMPVDFTLPNGVPVRGFIDRVDIAQTGEVRVVDYKTGKKPLPRYSQDAQFQMRFYALVYWRLFGVVPTQLKLMYLKVMDSMILTPSREELETSSATWRSCGGRSKPTANPARSVRSSRSFAGGAPSSRCVQRLVAHHPSIPVGPAPALKKSRPRKRTRTVR